MGRGLEVAGFLGEKFERVARFFWRNKLEGEF